MPKKHDRRADGQPYGYLLVLRLLGAGARRLGNHPAALRVLCLLAEYGDKDGRTKVSRETIAARLGITRQAVGKHMTVLADHFLITIEEARPGRAHRVRLGSDYIKFDDLAQERDGEMFVAIRRDNRKVAAARKSGLTIVSFEDRKGFPAYEAFMRENRSVGSDLRYSKAVQAMEAAEADAGFRYEEFGEEGGEIVYLQVEPATSEVVTPVTSEVTPPVTSEVA